jgi:hypothetical protein
MGQTVSRTDGGGNITLPDLRAKFIVGAGYDSGHPAGQYNVADTGGATSFTGTTGLPNDTGTTNSIGGTAGYATDHHGHSFTVSDLRPPYYALAYIMRV